MPPSFLGQVAASVGERCDLGRPHKRVEHAPVEGGRRRGLGRRGELNRLLVERDVAQLAFHGARQTGVYKNSLSPPNQKSQTAVVILASVDHGPVSYFPDRQGEFLPALGLFPQKLQFRDEGVSVPFQ